jgi:IS5 family transposase
MPRELAVLSLDPVEDLLRVVHQVHLVDRQHDLADAEQRVYGDSAYASQKALIKAKAPQARDFTNQRVRKGGQIDEAERSKNRNNPRVRARVEHVFAVVKRLWGFNKVRYRGLAKNTTRSVVALGLANIYLARRPMWAKVRS